MILLRPAHAYTYGFEPNPDWSSFYASGPEIRGYFENFAAKYELMRFIRLNSKVLTATWHEDEGICKIIKFRAHL
jgi:cation diffusion facilitator CzcD-associated flavoprotein CzcO